MTTARCCFAIASYFRASKHERVASAAAGRRLVAGAAAGQVALRSATQSVAIMPGAKKSEVRVATSAADVFDARCRPRQTRRLLRRRRRRLARRATTMGISAAMTARDEERGSAYDDVGDGAACEAAPKAESGSVAALAFAALSAFGFSAQAPVIVKFLTRSDPRAADGDRLLPPAASSSRGAAGCWEQDSTRRCAALRRGGSGDACVARGDWLGLRGLVGFGGVAFSFQAVSLLGIAEVQVVGRACSTRPGCNLCARRTGRAVAAAGTMRGTSSASIGVALQFGGHQLVHADLITPPASRFALAGAASRGRRLRARALPRCCRGESGAGRS